MLIPQIPSLLLLREKKFTTRGPSTSTRHCSVRLSPIAGKFPTAASRRSLGRVSVPVWLIILSDQLLIIALKRTVFSVYLCILSPVPLLPRVLRNRSDHIDIPSTQHRSSKGSRRPTKARKPGSFRKWIPIRRVHNRMDKLTLTRQFGIQFGIFLGRYREGIGM
ncbi:30S ribosomal protein S12, chloroplastic [Melia azedarach]|nr:30S ribosomal protein S12, chloroplastic [Melia azedarach]